MLDFMLFIDFLIVLMPDAKVLEGIKSMELVKETLRPFMET